MNLRALISPVALSAGRVVLGGKFARAYRAMRCSQWLSAEEQRRHAESRLFPLLRHTVRNVPFYQQSGINADRMRSMEQLSELPVVSKTLIRERGTEAFHAANLPLFRRLPRYTSGSTGEPFHFSLDRAAIPEIFASHLFWDSWIGLRPFDRYIRIEGPSLDDRAPGQEGPAWRYRPCIPETPLLFRWRQELTQQVKVAYEKLSVRNLCMYEVTPREAESVHRLITEFKPDFLLAYTSMAAILGEQLSRLGRQLSRPLRGVIAMAEPLTPQRRHTIENYFRAPITVRYGLKECSGWFAQNCEAEPGCLHVNTATTILELLRSDGTPAKPGELAHVVVTDLLNYAMPMIRYDTGDLAVALSGPCSCGRRWPRISRLEGRTHECVRTPSGLTVSPLLLAEYLWAGGPSFRHSDHLVGMQFYQLLHEQPDAVVFKLVPNENWNERRRINLSEDLQRLFGDGMRIQIEVVDNIPPERSGKRPIIKVQGAAQPAASFDRFGQPAEQRSCAS